MSVDCPGRSDEGLEGPALPELLQDCLTGAVLTVDARQRLAAFSPEAGGLLGLPLGQWLGRPVQELPVSLAALIETCFSTGQAIGHRPIVWTGPNRGERSLHAAAFPLRAADKGVTTVVVLLTDLTPVQELERNLQKFHGVASLGTLSAGMAHDIKNALVAVKTFVDLLVQKNQDSELAEIVRHELRRIDSMVSRMLECAGPRPVFGPVRLHEVLLHALRLLRPQLEEKRILVKRVLAAAPDWLHGDSYQLEQAFLNLFLNALEAMEPGGELSVTTSLTGASAPHAPEPLQLAVAIRDTGVGIAPENLRRLFEPFFTTKPTGTGLGLSIARRILEEHQGSVAVESAPGQGSVFRVTLPALPRRP